MVPQRTGKYRRAIWRVPVGCAAIVLGLAGEIAAESAMPYHLARAAAQKLSP